MVDRRSPRNLGSEVSPKYTAGVAPRRAAWVPVRKRPVRIDRTLLEKTRVSQPATQGMMEISMVVLQPYFSRSRPESMQPGAKGSRAVDAETYLTN